MRHTIFTALLLFGLASHAQEKITTFILIRHAEKDLTQSTNDPDLSLAGKKRAINLAEILKETEVTAIYSTPYKRTRQTVEILSVVKQLQVRDYTANSEEDIKGMLASHAGGTLVVSGHSNTIPGFINKLIGTEKYKPFEDDDYDNLIIVDVLEIGRVTKIVWLNY